MPVPMRMASGRLTLALTLVCAPLWSRASVQAQPPSPELSRTRYELQARIDGDRVLGAATIRFVNSAQRPVSDVLFHLYANAFESHDTVFVRDGGLALRAVPFARYGGIALTELGTERGEDLLAGAETTLVPNDRTQLRVALPAPVAPGAALTLRVTFIVRLPSLVARMGRAGDFYMVAQWFPKLARLGTDGTWSSTAYRGTGEFDADFADYELSVTAPKGFVIAAPGTRLPARGAIPKGTVIERFALLRARDMAFAAAPALIRAQAMSSHVVVDAYAPRGYGRLARDQAQRAARSLEQLERMLGRYPHDRLVLVIPPHEARGAAGMEYAGLIVGAAADPWSGLVPAASAHDLVTDHELAHQWFPMLVSNDELQSPMLDEGLAEWLCLHLARNDSDARFVSRWLGVPVNAFDVTAALLRTRRNVPSSLMRADEVNLRQLGPAMYFRPAVVLEAIAQRHGRERLVRALHNYAQAHRFQHVTLADLGAAFDAEYGAGFAKRELIPALEGGADASTSEHARAPKLSRSLTSRVLAIVQHALAWVGP